ncbi:hypothetical protein SPI_05701 [Niveomyces insectorum RCEF 264]|uniref:Uncharacterized protein n=1 Tax=Niveomyces insectorum RCEF 264 TaxID=1081102 RepID=A0A167TGG7_9HYPO|nr:hypothetical protein SPI_05701 [Niveomyces insectorum RCEF 264]
MPSNTAGRDETYKALFTSVACLESERRTASFQHYSGGPSLAAVCRAFVPTQHYQVHALRKDTRGWHTMKTTAYALEDPDAFDMQAYVRACVGRVVAEVCAASGGTSSGGSSGGGGDGSGGSGGSTAAVWPFFTLAWQHRHVPVIDLCLEMYATLHLLRKGWQFAGDETLGMGVGLVQDTQSAWFGRLTVPRMVQNQLGHALELHMAKLDRSILDAVHKLMEKRDRTMWVVTTLAVFLLLHIRELDAGRNIYWLRYPGALLGQTAASCNVLLWYYHCAIGQDALYKNWDAERSRKLVGDDQLVVASMKRLQAHVFSLRNSGLVGRTAAQVYIDGSPDSIAFTISSLLFTDVRSCTVQDLC